MIVPGLIGLLFDAITFLLGSDLCGVLLGIGLGVELEEEDEKEDHVSRGDDTLDDGEAAVVLEGQNHAVSKHGDELNNLQKITII